MEENGILKKSFLNTAEIYCFQLLLYRKAMKKLENEELVIKVEQKNGIIKYIKNPFLTLAEKASEILLKFLNVLLFTPAALNKLELLPKVAEEDNQIKGSDIFKQYIKDVQEKKILVCKKMQLVIKRHVKDLQRKDIYLDEKIIDDIYNFCRKYIKHVKGDIAKKTYILEPFQLFIAGSIFGWKKKEDNSRRYTKSFIFLARGNAKTDLAAISALYEYYESEKIGQEIIILATTKEQAAICFQRAANMISFNPKLRQDSKTSKVRHHNYKEKGKSTGVMKALASESNTLDGQRVTFGILDEIHAYKDRNLFDVIKSSQGTMKDTHLMMITTAGFLTNGFCMDEYNYAAKVLKEEVVADEEFIYIAELDSLKEWQKPEKYIKANPNLGKSVILEKLIQDQEKAFVDTESKKSFIAKNCNIFLNASSSHFDFQTFKENNGAFNINSEKMKELTWYGGVDLSNRLDLTSVSLVAFDKEKKLYILNK